MSSRRALQAVKVVDFTWAGVGPFTTKYLADYGATVIRIESRSHPCHLRTSPPFKDGVPGIDRSAFFASYSSNKYSMSVNISHPKGIKLVKKLIAWADIVAESYRAGVMEKWGLSYAEIRKIKPDIIMYRTNMQGYTGPCRHLPGSGLNLAGLGGFVHLSGWPDRPPVVPAGPYTDIIAPRFGATMLIAALDYRRKTGEGQLIEMSQFEAGISFVAPLMLDYFVNGRSASRNGNFCPCAAPHNSYRCKGEDRWCVIAVFSDEEWKSFCRAVGNPHWTEEQRFSTLLDRKTHEEELDRLVGEFTINHTAEEVVASMQSNGVAAGEVKMPADIMQDPQLKQRNHFWVMNHNEMGPFPHAGQPAILSETPAQPHMPSPCLGEHNDYVCKEILGIPEAEVNQLFVEGILD